MKWFLVVLMLAGCTAVPARVHEAEGMKLQILEAMARSFREFVTPIPAIGEEAEGKKAELLGTIERYRDEYRALAACTLRWLEFEDPLARVDKLVEQGEKLIEAVK